MATVPPLPTEEDTMSEKGHHHGDFAEGQETEEDEQQKHEGSFAEGETEQEEP